MGNDSAHIFLPAKFHALHIAIALQNKTIVMLLNDTVQNIMPRRYLRKDSIANIIIVTFLQKDPISRMLYKRTHAITFDVYGIGFTFPQHLRHLAQPSIVRQFVTRLIGNHAVAFAISLP